MNKYHHSAPQHKPALLSIYSDRTCIGLILSRGKAGFEAFTADDKSLGLFSTEQSAADAISAAVPA
jgi:hypothetical protein